MENIKNLEQRLQRLEDIILPKSWGKTIDGGANWKKRELGKPKLIAERCWPDDPTSIVYYANENTCAMYLESQKDNNGKPYNRIVAHMNRGVVLYSDYLPIYKDILAMMEK